MGVLKISDLRTSVNILYRTLVKSTLGLSSLCEIGMVLFYCTFLALRAQDSGDPIDVNETGDHELSGEELIYGG